MRGRPGDQRVLMVGQPLPPTHQRDHVTRVTMQGSVGAVIGRAPECGFCFA